MHRVSWLVIVASGLGQAGCRNTPARPPAGPERGAHVTVDPSDRDIIQAVRRSVEGKTYEVTSTTQEPRRHFCSQSDVDRDPHMPRNPELARCPRVGTSYTTWETVSRRDTRRCDPPPDPQHGWHVLDIGDDRWRVTQGGSAWDVLKVEGGSVEKAGHVELSGFSFRIEAHQRC